jgi:uncharacterized RDD family membrane protein YckC
VLFESIPAVESVPCDGDLRCASFTRRACAYAIDHGLLNCFRVVCYQIRESLAPALKTEHALFAGITLVLLASTLLLAEPLYFAISESSTTKATPGKWVLGLRVCGNRGEGLSFGRCLARYFVEFAAMMAGAIAGYLLGGWFWCLTICFLVRWANGISVFFYENRQTVFDVWTKRFVVYNAKDDKIGGFSKCCPTNGEESSSVGMLLSIFLKV